jgi:hypothetical protein
MASFIGAAITSVALILMLLFRHQDKKEASKTESDKE